MNIHNHDEFVEQADRIEELEMAIERFLNAFTQRFKPTGIEQEYADLEAVIDRESDVGP